MVNYYVGLDLGQRSDPTALAIIETPLWIPHDLHAPRDGGRWVSPSDPGVEARQLLPHATTERPTLALRHLERYQLGTSYPKVVEHVAGLMQRWPLLGQAVLLVDATGVGRPVVDLFERAGLAPLAITITGGNEVTEDGSEIHVPKRDLAMTCQTLLQSRRLVFAAELPLLDVLKRELQSFEVKISTRGHDTYEAWRVGTHDDLVLAVCLAVWYREWRSGAPAIGFCRPYTERPRRPDSPFARRIPPRRL